MTINPENNYQVTSIGTTIRQHGDRINVTTHEGKTLENIKKYSDEQGRFLLEMGKRFKVFDVVVKLQDANGRVAYVNRRSLGDKLKRLTDQPDAVSIKSDQPGTASVKTVAQRISSALKSLFPSLTYSNAAKDNAVKEFFEPAVSPVSTAPSHAESKSAAKLEASHDSVSKYQSILDQLPTNPNKVNDDTVATLENLIRESPLEGCECLLRYVYSLPYIPTKLNHLLIFDRRNDTAEVIPELQNNLAAVIPRLKDVQFQGDSIKAIVPILRAYVQTHANDQEKVDLGYTMMAKLIDEKRTGPIQTQRDPSPTFEDHELEIIGSRHSSSIVSLDLSRNDLQLFEIIKRENPADAYKILLDQNLGGISLNHLVKLTWGIPNLTRPMFHTKLFPASYNEVVNYSKEEKAFVRRYVDTGGDPELIRPSLRAAAGIQVS